MSIIAKCLWSGKSGLIHSFMGSGDFPTPGRLGGDPGAFSALREGS